MKLKNCLFLLIALSFILHSSIVLQGQSDSFSPEMEQQIKEKLHHLIRVGDVDAFLDMAKNHPDRLLEMQSEAQRPGRASAEQNGEVIISDSNLPESELHAAMNPEDSNSIVVAVMRQDPNSFTSPLTTPIYYTEDFGQNWSASEFKGEFPDLGLWAGGGDPLLAYGTDGRIHYTWLVVDLNVNNFLATIGLHYMTSDDGGANWEYGGVVDMSQPFNLLSLEGIDKFVDKQWMAIDANEGPTQNNLYMAYVALEFDSASVNYNMLVTTKYADSSSFSTPVSVNPDSFLFAQFSSIDVDRQGRVHLTFAGSKDSVNYGMYHTVSEDEGQSFSRPRLISPFTLPELTYFDDDFSILGVQDRLYPCPHVKVDPSIDEIYSGRIYSFWTANGIDTPKTRGLDIYFSFSDDGGLTWTRAEVLSEQGTPEEHQYYSSVSITPSGRLVVTYYDRHAGGDSSQTHYVLTQSDDGGIQWSDPVPLSGETSDFSAIGSQNAGFGIGEYNQTLVTKYQAIPIWSDGRTNDGNINVYAAFVPYDQDSTVGVDQWQSIHRSWSVSSVAPNPVKAGEWVQLGIQSAHQGELQLSWYNNAGQELSPGKSVRIFPNGEQTVDLRTPDQAGIYYLKIYGIDGVYVHKVVLQ